MSLLVDITTERIWKYGIKNYWFIALDDDTICYLQEWQILQNKNVLSKYVLSYNGLPTNKSTARHIIERHSKLAGVHRIKTHALRHSHEQMNIY